MDLYCTDPNAWCDSKLSRANAWLSERERQRATRFRCEDNRRLYLVAHAMLRHTLAEQLCVLPSSVEFDYNTFGRPELAGACTGALRFSLSHARGMAVCAITAQRDIGVDVESLGRELPWAVAERSLAPFELEDLKRQDIGTRAARFFTYWTLKEAYVKARGLGLGMPLDGVAFALSEGGVQSRVQFRPTAEVESAPTEWAFRAFPIASSHLAALALRSSAPVSVAIHDFSLIRG